MVRDDRRDNGEDKEHSEPVIEDMRHSRDLDAEPVEPLKVIEPPAARAPEPQPGPTPPEPPAAAPRETRRPEVVEEEVIPEEASLEMEQLRQIFGAGLLNYLRSQLGLLINFAVLYLGRAPNPATGLLNTDLPKAKIAIDLLEIITGLIQAEMAPAERTELSNILAELKYTFLQSATISPQAPDPPSEA